MDKNSFYSREELSKLGFKSFGTDVLISRKASFYSIDEISLGNHVRIDDFCILSGKIEIGNYVHISASVLLFAGDKGIRIDDFVSVSSRVAIYAVSDDYSGEYMANPMVDNKYRNVAGKEIVIEKHVLIGTGSTILPDVTIKEGCSFGAMSLINEDCEPWGIYVGIPCRRIKERSKRVLSLADKMLIERKG